MPSQNAIYRFGPYELRTRTREVYKYGTKLKLRRQPFQVLHALAEHSGDVVTREELCRLLWPAETFVDFELGLNTAIKELRGLLNESASEPRYIETLPKLGYRIIVPVESDLAGPLKQALASQEAKVVERVVPASESAHDFRRVLGRRPWPIAAALAVMLIAGLAGSVQWFSSRARLLASSGRAMVAVLPFENLGGNSGQDYFSDGLTEEMIAQLGRLDPEHLGVIARSSVMHYKHTQEPLQQIGRELGVEYVVEGSVRRDTNKVRISAQLIQLRDQTHLWARQYDRELGGLLALQDEVTQEIAEGINVTLGEHNLIAARVHEGSAHSPSPEAYDLYLKGRYFWNKRTPEGFQQAAECFQQAIAKDPNYAAAYAGLADTFGLMSTYHVASQNEFMPKARTAALRALQIDETLAAAHTSLALIAEHYDYDSQTAEKEFRRAIQHDPSYATAHQWYAEYLSFQGRFDEALDESERARRLDPMSLIIAADRGAILYYARQYDRAIDQCRAVLDMDSSFGRARGIMVTAFVQEGRFADALSEVERLPRDLAWAQAWARALETYIYGHMGRMAQAQQAFARLKQLSRHSQTDFTPELLVAYIGMHRKDQAIVLLQRAYVERSNAVVGIKVDPNYDSLRADPRFQDLLRRSGLAQ